jgi:hypothetical protein
MEPLNLEQVVRMEESGNPYLSRTLPGERKKSRLENEGLHVEITVKLVSPLL